MHRQKSNPSKVSAQLSMYKDLDGPNTRRETLVGELIQAIRNLQYITTRVLVSNLDQTDKLAVSAIMTDANLTLCQSTHQIGLSTSRYRKMPKAHYDILAALPDSLNHFDAEDADILTEYVQRSSSKINGLFIAYKDVIPGAISPKKTLTLLYQAESYLKHLI